MEQWICPKCQNNEFAQDQIHATGDNLSKILNLQDKTFITLSCTKCGYTELYKKQTSTGMNILDLLIGG